MQKWWKVTASKDDTRNSACISRVLVPQHRHQHKYAQRTHQVRLVTHRSFSFASFQIPKFIFPFTQVSVATSTWSMNTETERQTTVASNMDIAGQGPSKTEIWLSTCKCLSGATLLISGNYSDTTQAVTYSCSSRVTFKAPPSYILK